MTIQFKKKTFFTAYVMFLSTLAAVFFGLITVSGAGCNDDNTINNVSKDIARTNNVSVGVYSENATGDNTLILTEAKFVVRQLMIKNINGVDHNVNLGPFVVNLDMRQDVIIVGIAQIPAGDYDKIKFQVHKPNPHENIADPDFTEGNSRRFSVVTKGSYNNVPFVFKSDVTTASVLDLENGPVTIDELVNITIRLDVYSWFVINGEYIDPTDENNRNIIRQNIKNSLRRAFRDANLDGQPD